MQASTSHLSAQRASNARPTSVSSARRPLRCRPSRATPIAAVKEVRLPMPTGLVFTQKQEGGPGEMSRRAEVWCFGAPTCSTVCMQAYRACSCTLSASSTSSSIRLRHMVTGTLAPDHT